MESRFSNDVHLLFNSSRKGTNIRDLSGSFSSSSSRFVRVYEEMTVESPHFLDSCYFCKKPLRQNKDIYMYRGDIPFCSEECRQEQIDIDEATEKQRKLSVKMVSKKEQQKSSSETKNFRVRNQTIVA